MVQDLLPIAAVRFGAICRHRCVITMPMTTLSQNCPVFDRFFFKYATVRFLARWVFCLCTSAALVASAQTSGFQDIHPCLSFVGWHRSCDLADECTLVTAAGRRPLRSADNRTCLVKRSRNQFGDRCFATAGPTLWNSQPEQLRQPDITFKRSLKTLMFG